MIYKLEIHTSEPKDVYTPSRRYDNVPACDPLEVYGADDTALHANADAMIESVLSKQYVETSPEHITHEVDQPMVWTVDGETLIKYVYTAYKHDFTGYDRYLARLTPMK